MTPIVNLLVLILDHHNTISSKIIILTSALLYFAGSIAEFHYTAGIMPGSTLNVTISIMLVIISRTKPVNDNIWRYMALSFGTPSIMVVALPSMNSQSLFMYNKMNMEGPLIKINETSKERRDEL